MTTYFLGFAWAMHRVLPYDRAEIFVHKKILFLNVFEEIILNPFCI